jgi:hypothetical protein
MHKAILTSHISPLAAIHLVKHERSFPYICTMVRKTLIFFTLLSAYLMLLGHDLIPHHHHGDHPSAEHHQHDDYDDYHDENSDDDHEGWPETFSHFAHTPYSSAAETLVITAPVKQTPVQAIIFLADPLQLHCLKAIPAKHHPPDEERCHSLLLVESLPLRAPPAC